MDVPPYGILHELWLGVEADGRVIERKGTTIRYERGRAFTLNAYVFLLDENIVIGSKIFISAVLLTVIIYIR